MTTTRTPAHTAATASTPRNTVFPRTLQKRSHPARGSKRPTRTGVGQARTELPRTERTDLMPPSTVLHPRQHSRISRLLPQLPSRPRSARDAGAALLCGFCSRSLFSSSPWGFPGSMMSSRPVLSASSGRSVRAVPLFSQRLPASVSGRVGCAGKAALGTGASDRAHHFLRDRLGWHSPCMRCPTGCPRSMTL